MPSQKPKQARRSLPEEAEQLLTRFSAGDPEAFQTLVRPHLPSLVALGRRLTGDSHWAEDLTQETLVRAFEGRAGFRGEASVRTWLFRIQVRLAGSPGRWRRQERAGVPAVDVPDHLECPPEDAAFSRELRDRLAEAMERLTTRQQTALHLRAVEGLDYATIAQVLGGSLAAARMLVLAARKKVMERMGRYLEP